MISGHGYKNVFWTLISTLCNVSGHCNIDSFYSSGIEPESFALNSLESSFLAKRKRPRGIFFGAETPHWECGRGGGGVKANTAGLRAPLALSKWKTLSRGAGSLKRRLKGARGGEVEWRPLSSYSRHNAPSILKKKEKILHFGGLFCKTAQTHTHQCGNFFCAP